MALNAARTATSVLPKPTSPASRRSIGIGPLHVGLHLVDGLQLVGRLGERERLLELVLPRGVGAERVALRRHARGVELHELDGDLAHGLARAALGLGPVAAAHLREGGRLAADVAAEQVELVGGHEELVARLAALGRRVLEHEVLAHGGGLLLDAGGAARPGGAAAGRDLALHHLDEPADAVRLVHDVVAGLQLQRVDDVAAPGRELLVLPGVVAGRAAVELGLGDEPELRLGHLEAARGVGLHEVGDARVRGRRAPARRCARRARPRRARRARARRGRDRRMPRRGSTRRAAGRRRGRRRPRRCPAKLGIAFAATRTYSEATPAAASAAAAVATTPRRPLRHPRCRSSRRSTTRDAGRARPAR